MEVLENAKAWTVSIPPGKVDDYLAVKSLKVPSANSNTPST
jgi:hypothetical protein